MSEPTKAAMRLATLIQNEGIFDGHIGSGFRTNDIMRKVTAEVLDDAGLREAVEALEFAVNHKMTSSDKIYLLQQIGGCREVFKRVLSALQGTDDAPQ